jgi:hypothetical protein
VIRIDAILQDGEGLVILLNDVQQATLSLNGGTAMAIEDFNIGAGTTDTAPLGVTTEITYNIDVSEVIHGWSVPNDMQSTFIGVIDVGQDGATVFRNPEIETARIFFGPPGEDLPGFDSGLIEDSSSLIFAPIPPPP